MSLHLQGVVIYFITVFEMATYRHLSIYHSR